MSNKVKVTIAIPTYNRSEMLKSAIDSALSQRTNIKYEVLVLDNASTDNTEKTVRNYMDSKLKYIKNKTNIGMMGNWNKAIEECKGEYLMILGDDDWLYQDFLSESVSILDKNTNVGFTFARCNKVDNNRKYLMEWGYKFTPTGYLKGTDYLFYTLDNESCMTNSSTVLIRKDAFNKIGRFEAEFGKNTFDFNMWIKIASKYDIFFINKFISDYRIHPYQVTENHWRTVGHPTGKIGTYLELLKVIAILSEYTNEKLFSTNYLKDKIITISKYLTELISKILPDL